MSTTESAVSRRPFHGYATIVVVALAVAFFVTAGGWFLAAKASPIDHGVFPDVHDRPDMMIWVIMNIPAAFLFISCFGKLGSEASYFLCVFLQWLLIGAIVGTVIATTRRAKV